MVGVLHKRERCEYWCRLVIAVTQHAYARMNLLGEMNLKWGSEWISATTIVFVTSKEEEKVMRNDEMGKCACHVASFTLAFSSSHFFHLRKHLMSHSLLLHDKLKAASERDPRSDIIFCLVCGRTNLAYLYIQEIFIYCQHGFFFKKNWLAISLCSSLHVALALSIHSFLYSWSN